MSGRGGGGSRGGAYYKNKYGRGRQGDAPVGRSVVPTEALFSLSDGAIALPYGEPRPMRELGNFLERLEGAGYGAYGDLAGTTWTFHDDLCLIVDKTQKDPFAPPSRMRLVGTEKYANLCPAAFESASARVATADFFARRFFGAARARGDDQRTETGGWGGKKGGEIRIAVPSQFILKRTSTCVSSRGAVEARFTVALPAQGRSCQGRWAAQILCTRLFELAKETFCSYVLKDLENHVDSVLDQQYLRQQLKAKKLVAFIGDGALLPRRAGNDDRPMAQNDAELFSYDKSVALKNRRGSVTRGLGLPEGVTLICGGGFHGKSTLLAALSVGVYDKIPGDGRELCVSVVDMAKIRAEDGRSVSNVDVSAFIGALPGKSLVSTKSFSTKDASGSTSQAAHVAEAVEAGATCLLFDEDTCATNFMIRDDKMRQLVDDDDEPITPFVDRVRHLYENHGVSSVLVMGGTGDYFKVSDAVIVMKDYKPIDATDRAKELGGQPSRNLLQPPTYFTPRRLISNPAEGRCSVRSKTVIAFGDNNDLDISALAQIIELTQVNAILATLVHFNSLDQPRPLPATFATAIANLHDDLDTLHLDVLNTAYGGITGDLAQPRRLDIAAALNRLRTANFCLIKPL